MTKTPRNSGLSAKSVRRNMEIESKNGFKTRLQKHSENLDFGRGLGFDSTDRTVSRRHISFKLHEDRTNVSFEVKGKNPVWVHDGINDEIRVYKTSEGGEIKSGDSFCVSSKNPVWFNLKKIASEDEDDHKSRSDSRFNDALAETSGSGIDYDEIETGDISHIDPVKEFNFVVMGHEFDCYPKKMIRDIRHWNWFLEEPKENSDDDDDDNERKAKKVTKKRKKGGRNDDDDDVWTGESEEDAEMIKKLRNVPKPKYSTRSKNQKKNKKDASVSTSTVTAKDDEDDDDDDDETLGGFIVDDEETKGDDEDGEEEEEEFEEDEYEDDE